MTHKLIVLPDDSSKPILDAINGATRSLNVRMFLFTDTSLLDAVIAAKGRGVKVRVMLNPARRSGEAENEQSRKTLVAAGVEVRDSNPAFCSIAVLQCAVCGESEDVIPDPVQTDDNGFGATTHLRLLRFPPSLSSDRASTTKARAGRRYDAT